MQRGLGMAAALITMMLCMGQTASSGQQAGTPASGNNVVPPPLELLTLEVTSQMGGEVQQLAKPWNPSQDRTQGLTAAFKITYPDADVIQAYSFVLTRFEDDKGNDLGSGRVQGSNGREQELFGVTSDHQAMVVRLASSRVPAKDANSLVIEGTASLRIGRGAKELEKRSLRLFPGRTWTGSEGTLTVTELQETREREGPGVRISFAGTGDLARLRNVWVTDEAGTNLVAGFTLQQLQQRASVAQVRLTTQPATVLVTPILYEDIRTVQLPVNLRLGVGVAAAKEIP